MKLCVARRRGKMCLHVKPSNIFYALWWEEGRGWGGCICWSVGGRAKEWGRVGGLSTLEGCGDFERQVKGTVVDMRKRDRK